MRLLIAEDDDRLRHALARALREASYAVDAVVDGDAALTHALVNAYDALVLDVLLPGQDGLSICRALRARGSSVPILLLTARHAIDDRISGLDAGADDYLTKPFANGELLARLRALLRRVPALLPATIEVSDRNRDSPSAGAPRRR